MNSMYRSLGTKIFSAFIVFLLAFFASPVVPVYAANTPATAPTAVDPAPAATMTNPNNGFASDNAYTVAGNGGLFATYMTFNFAAIPAGSTIDGIVVSLEGNRTAGSGRVFNVDLSWNGEANYTATLASPAYGQTDTTVTVGGATNTWGRTWNSATDFTNANFRVRVTSTNGGGTINLDQMLVTIYYTASVPTTTVGDGNTPANKTMGASATNVAASSFTLSTNIGSDTVTDLVVTGTNTANVAPNGVKIYRDNGGTANEWDGTDTLVATASFGGTTATFTGINLPVTTTATQYIITYDTTAAPTSGQTLTAFVSSATATNPVTNNDNTDAALTIDTVAPTVMNVDSTTAAGTYNAGDTIVIRVTFSEAVTVTGTPQITLETGAIDRTVNYTGGSGSTQLTFTYTVQAGDTSADLDYVAANSLGLNGGTIRDTVGNNAVLTLPAPGAAGSLSANEALIIDTTAPTVTINQASGQADPASTQPINFTVVFSETVTGFTGADIVLTGTAGPLAGATRTITGGPLTYNVAISGLTTAGTVIASMNANSVNDNAGNNNIASTSTDNTVTLSGFTLTSSVGPGTNGGTGTIAPSGTVNVIGGASQAYASTPNAGSILSNFTDNSFSYGPVNNYTLANIDANHTIVATFDGGWSVPTTSANGASACGGAGNAFTSNNSFTTCGSGDSAIYSNFNLNIPQGQQSTTLRSPLRDIPMGVTLLFPFLPMVALTSLVLLPLILPLNLQPLTKHKG